MTTKGRIDVAKVRSATEADKARWDVEDGYDDRDFGPERFVLPKTDVRALRERLALSQEAFSERYFLPLRTIQDWEQRRREPSEPARVLLYAIDCDAKGVEAILGASSAGQLVSSRRVLSRVASASPAPKPTKRRKSA
jgi:putative transcriptional regulator